MSHDDHSQFFAEILKLVNLYKRADGVDIIQSRYYLCIIPAKSQRSMHERRAFAITVIMLL